MSVFNPNDQASGLRAAVQARRLPVLPPTPCLYADFLLFKGACPQLPPAALIWHWRDAPTPAVGWDLQSRLHVVGSPTQYDLVELQRWRVLFPQWRLVSKRLETLLIADIACLWLAPGMELIPRLQHLLGWLSKKRPQMPIILAGIGSGAAQRLQIWARDRYPLLNLSPSQELTERPTHGYYRLLRIGASRRATALALNARLTNR
ncbi:MAG: hypothetical protein ACK4NB_04975 [Fimbriimonadales bacterium]